LAGIRITRGKTAVSDFQVVESAALIDQIPSFAQADEEPEFRFYQGEKQFIPIAAPVHDPHPFPLGRLADRLDGRQDLDVFALMIRTPLGKLRFGPNYWGKSWKEGRDGDRSGCSKKREHKLLNLYIESDGFL